MKLLQQGMTIFDPHRIHPSKVDNSSRQEEYGSISWSPSVGHPCCTYCRTFDNLLLHLVQTWISLAVTGESAKCSTSRMSFGSFAVVVDSSRSGNLLNASAFA